VSADAGAAVQVLHRFYAHLDDRRYADVVALMCADVCWHRQGEALRGHAAVMRALERRPPNMMTLHVITNAFAMQAPPGEIALSALMTAYRGSVEDAGALPVTIRGPFRASRLSVRFRREGTHWKIAEQDGVATFEFANA